MTDAALITEALDPIAAHIDGCACPRCVELTACPACQRLKLDIDWCWSCRRLVFLPVPAQPQGRPYFANDCTTKPEACK